MALTARLYECLSDASVSNWPIGHVNRYISILQEVEKVKTVKQFTSYEVMAIIFTEENDAF